MGIGGRKPPRVFALQEGWWWEEEEEEVVEEVDVDAESAAEDDDKDEMCVAEESKASSSLLILTPASPNKESHQVDDDPSCSLCIGSCDADSALSPRISVVPDDLDVVDAESSSGELFNKFFSTLFVSDFRVLLLPSEGKSAPPVTPLSARSSKITSDTVRIVGVSYEGRYTQETGDVSG